MAYEFAAADKASQYPGFPGSIFAMKELDFEFALKAAGAGAWEWDIKTDEARWSQKNYELMGLPPGSGKADYNQWLSCVHPDDRDDAQRKVSDAIESRGDLDFIYRAVWPDGSVKWVRDLGKMLLDADGDPIGMYGIQLDVTEQRALEEKLRSSQRSEAMGRIAGALAHDFNNLLTVIGGYGALVENHPQLNPSLRDMLREIRRASQQAAKLTTQLLAFGRRQTLSPEVINLNSIILRMKEMLRQTLGERIKFRINLAADLHPVVADPSQIEQVLVNLIMNARDSMPVGGTLTIETRNGIISADDKKAPPLAVGSGYVRMSVEDTGHGMDPKTLDRIFEPFFTTKPAGLGSGLGLASVHGIIHQSGGYVNALSKPGLGTAFVIDLPQSGEDSSEAHRSSEPNDVIPLQGNETILVVEDGPAIRKLVRETLAGYGYHVLAAASGEEALDLVAGHGSAFDLLLTDVVLPGMSGPELSARLTRADPGLKTLLMSGYSYEASVTGAEILPKPFSPLDLATKVRRLLDGPRVVE